MKKVLCENATGLLTGIKHPPKEIRIHVEFIGSGRFEDYITDTGDVIIGKLLNDIRDGVIKVEW